MKVLVPETLSKPTAGKSGRVFIFVTTQLLAVRYWLLAW